MNSISFGKNTPLIKLPSIVGKNKHGVFHCFDDNKIKFEVCKIPCDLAHRLHMGSRRD